LAAAIPSLPQSISSALAIDALRPELQERIEIALQKRTRESPIVLAPVRGENAPAEPALAEASQRALRHLLEVEVNEVRIAVESVGDQPSGCRMRILTSADIRLWDVSARSTIFSQHAVGPGAELTVSMDELPVILDQPRALRARVINQYEDIIVGVLDSPRLKFSAAP
jgi:hypothetical protein